MAAPSPPIDPPVTPATVATGSGHSRDPGPRNVAVLVAAQAVLGSQMPIIFILGGLAGQSLSPNACLATLPITATVVGSMLSANPLSLLMARRGRRTGFVVGAMAGALGAAIAVLALLWSSFWLFVAGAFLTGTYQSSQGFFRFAAADTATPAFRPKAISWVLAGGLLSAIIGPQLVKLTADTTVVPFLGTYLTVIALNLAGVWLFVFLDVPKPVATSADAPRGRSRIEMMRDPGIAVAMICATVSYALMNLVMTSTPLAVVGCGFLKADAADIVSAHVLAMFAPSFFTGHLIARFGVTRIIGAGLVILAGAGVVALSGVHLTHFYGALILLGLGWNFGFIGATTLLTQSYRPEERGRIQGLNDFVVFGGVSFASLFSGGLMNCAGGSVVSGWHMVNVAMLPFLLVAGGALVWLARQKPAIR